LCSARNGAGISPLLREPRSRKEQMMAQSDAEILKSAYEAFANGDVPGVLAVLAEDIDFHIPGDSPVAGTYTGHDEVVGFFQKLGQLSNGTFTVTAREIFDNGTGTVAALCTLGGERNGQNSSFDTVQVWRFADGKATSFREFNDDQAGLDAFWS
jgi:ketosteroid isomerase-like protein